MKTSIQILLFLLASVSTYAQNTADHVLLSGSPSGNPELSKPVHSHAGFYSIDAFASGINTDQFYSHEDLSQYLTDRYRSQREKVRSIFTWIATNISYDQQFLQQEQSRSSQLAEMVWNNRMAVCEGYANLFNEMCEASGIESRMIKGYTREFMDRELKLPNHAWNSVMIDGKWYLLDVTWASINANPMLTNTEISSGLKIKERLDNFFLVDPEKMISTHLPEDPYWQLQSKTIDLETFMHGEGAIQKHLESHKGYKPVNFEELISRYEELDSLDRSIAYMERMVADSPTAKAYGLGIAYFYKAQDILKRSHQEDKQTVKELKKQAKTYFQLSLECLSLLEKDDYGYDFSQDLTDNVLFRMEILQ